MDAMILEAIDTFSDLDFDLIQMSDEELDAFATSRCGSPRTPGAPLPFEPPRRAAASRLPVARDRAAA